MLNMDKLPGAYKMLANLYAAESLILMDKMNEAIEYLKPQNIYDLDASLDVNFLPESTDIDNTYQFRPPKTSKSERLKNL